MVDYLSASFRALADPTRREIVATLVERRTATVKTLAEPHAMSLTAVLKHVRILEQAGLVRRRKIGRENHLTLDPKPLEDAGRWLEFSWQHWNARFADLEQALAMEAESTTETKPTTKRKKR